MSRDHSLSVGRTKKKKKNKKNATKLNLVQLWMNEFLLHFINYGRNKLFLYFISVLPDSIQGKLLK